MLQLSRKLVLIFWALGLGTQLLGALDQSVSFANSMGLMDVYMQERYENFASKLNKPSSRWFRYVGSQGGYSSIKVLESLYAKHTDLKAFPDIPKIPKIIHQIWIGPLPLPEKYKKWQVTWQNLPGWTYKLWTDEEIKDFNLINSDIYYKEKNFGARADLLRIEILYREGGVYIDMDYECIQPQSFDILNCLYDFYCGITPLDCSALLLNNALIGSMPKHPILGAIIANVPLVCDEIRNTNMAWSDAILMKGPGLLTKCFLKHAGQDFSDIAFPPTFFYPLGVFQIDNEQWNQDHSANCRGMSFFDYIKSKIMKPETIAIHWWDGSWAMPEAMAS